MHMALRTASMTSCFSCCFFVRCLTVFRCYSGPWVPNWVKMRICVCGCQIGSKCPLVLYYLYDLEGVIFFLFRFFVRFVLHWFSLVLGFDFVAILEPKTDQDRPKPPKISPRPPQGWVHTASHTSCAHAHAPCAHANATRACARRIHTGNGTWTCTRRHKHVHARVRVWGVLERLKSLQERPKSGKLTAERPLRVALRPPRS